MERAGRLALDLCTKVSALGESHPCVDKSFCGVPVGGQCVLLCGCGESL